MKSVRAIAVAAAVVAASGSAALAQTAPTAHPDAPWNSPAMMQPRPPAATSVPAPAPAPTSPASAPPAAPAEAPAAPAQAPAATPTVAAPAAAPTPAPAPASAAAATPPAASPAPPPAITAKPPSADERAFLLAEAHFNAKNYQDAYLQLLPLAHRGHTQSQYLLGLMADNGVGPVQLNPREAMRWYRLAAEKNHAEAQFAISNAYANGRGVEINPQEMVAWLRRAAENGYMPAMISMAALHDYGMGVPVDPAEGTVWIKRAAEAGGVAAAFQYARRLETGFGIEKNPDEALKWYRRASDRGHPGAQLRLGTVADPTATSPEENIAAYVWLSLALQRGTGDVRTRAQEQQRELQRNMTPTDIQEATQRVQAWRQAPQAPGLRPDPEYDVPVGTAAAPQAPRAAGGG